MDRVSGLLFLLVFALAPLAALPQDVPSHPKPGGKVCVATVSNMSARAAVVDRLTERVSKDLRDDKINAVTMDSGTTTGHKLIPPAKMAKKRKARTVITFCSPKSWIRRHVRSIRRVPRFPSEEKLPA
jgi:hypothetical protein